MKKVTSNVRDFDDKSGTEDWTDDDGEVRELTSADFAQMTPFAELPKELKVLLLQVKRAAIDREVAPKEKVELELSRPVLERFRAEGSGWQAKVDAALLEWMEDHKAS